MRNDNPILRGVLMVLLAAMLWGTTGTAQTLAPAGLSAYWVGAWRLVVASAFFALWWTALRRRASAPVAAAAPWGLVLAAGGCVAAYNLSFFAGVASAGVAVGTAVAIGSGPIWAGLLQVLATGRAPAPAWWAGTLCAVAGGVLLVLGQGGGARASLTGVGLCLLAGLSYAAYALLSKRLVARASTSWATLGVFGSAALIAVPAAWAMAGAPSTNAQGWLVVLYLGVATTGVAYLLFAHALRHISGPTGVTLALAEPVTAFVLAIAVVGERPQAMAFAGLALVLAGLGLVVWREVRAGG